MQLKRNRCVGLSTTNDQWDACVAGNDVVPQILAIWRKAYETALGLGFLSRRTRTDLYESVSKKVDSTIAILILLKVDRKLKLVGCR